MTDVAPLRRVATLWQLELHDDRLSCNVYRGDRGFLLRLESPTAIILSEPVELQPRTMARSDALRDSLRRRGWQDCPVQRSATPKLQ